MDKFNQANREMWDRRAEHHFTSKFYDVPGFKAGKSSLDPVEVAELGPEVAGKTMLHLQCHFGLDTMSWARLGAIPTGVDYSAEAIRLAKGLNEELGLNCRFIETDVYKLPEKLDEQFDIVFTSYGVLTWLPDLRSWAELIAHYLKPGGTFYIAEIHPFSYIMDDSKMEKPDLRVAYPYFDTEAMEFEASGTYTDGRLDLGEKKQYEWMHTMEEIINALIEAGLVIEYLHEFDFTVFQQFDFLEKKGRNYHLPEGMHSVPLLFSLRAQKI